MDIRALDRRALDLTGRLVARVRPARLTSPTPCPDWTLYGLLRHLVAQNAGFAAAAEGSADLAPWQRAELGDDPAAAYERSAERVTAAFAAADALERTFAMPELGTGAAFPGRVAIGFHLLDYVVHAWDVAATLDLPWEPDEELTSAALRVAERIPDETRSPGSFFGPRAPLPADASPRRRLLALAGRTPREGEC
ncbi:TIGR03086 family metal-binding protein [Bailinhaonella thermotolerans]|uniref:TIGR03086 family protein n=1 Tax=Bailinhaonella thermotolerans TaxID=1070861 RepID=A0A3A4B420_9ACTN|nr:TIGR03086 family metal-binding protein [Bailinhaonella thermotolerans]RJL35911.1 TIGR03086 family protein [Bailinhaonella thermotolerans]